MTPTRPASRLPDAECRVRLSRSPHPTFSANPIGRFPLPRFCFRVVVDRDNWQYFQHVRKSGKLGALLLCVSTIYNFVCVSVYSQSASAHICSHAPASLTLDSRSATSPSHYTSICRRGRSCGRAKRRLVYTAGGGRKPHATCDNFCEIARTLPWSRSAKFSNLKWSNCAISELRKTFPEWFWKLFVLKIFTKISSHFIYANIFANYCARKWRLRSTSRARERRRRRTSRGWTVCWQSCTRSCVTYLLLGRRGPTSDKPASKTAIGEVSVRETWPLHHLIN